MAKSKKQKVDKSARDWDDKKKETLVERYKNIILEFKKDVCDKSDDIDPNEELQWKDMSIGYFLAKGVDVDIALELAIIVRYDFHYWQPLPEIEELPEGMKAIHVDVEQLCEIPKKVH